MKFKQASAQILHDEIVNCVIQAKCSEDTSKIQGVVTNDISLRWGEIIGDINNQSDLMALINSLKEMIQENSIENSLQDVYKQLQEVIDKLELKQDKLVAGNNILINDNIISADLADINDKLDTIEPHAQVNVIDSVSNEFTIEPIMKRLKINSIEMGEVTGLPEALQQINDSSIKSVSINSNLIIAEKGNVDIPIATLSSLGLVRSSSEENGVNIDSKGCMEINSLNVNKLSQSEGDTLLLECN